MPGEIPSVNPEDLIVQKGKDRGRIKDKNLAKIGAESEDKARTENEKIARKPINRLKKALGMYVQQEYPNLNAKQAMQREVYERSQSLPREDRTFREVSSFRENLDQKENEQKYAKSGPKSWGRGTDPEQLVEQSGIDAGRIKDVDLAEIGAEAEDQQREDNKKYAAKPDRYPGWERNPDTAGLDTMAHEVGKRALHTEHEGEESRWNKGYKTAVNDFVENQEEKQEEGKEARENN